MKVPELKAELVALGLPTSGNKPTLLQAVIDARLDLHSVRAAAAPILARTEIQHQSDLTTQQHQVQHVLPSGESVLLVLPTFRLPEPYQMPVASRAVRKSPAAGQQKWTAKRRSAASALIAMGGTPIPLSRNAGIEDHPPDEDAPMPVFEESDEHEDMDVGENAVDDEEGEEQDDDE